MGARGYLSVSMRMSHALHHSHSPHSMVCVLRHMTLKERTLNALHGRKRTQERREISARVRQREVAREVEGKVKKFTIGYVMDRDQGNTGGLGGAYGLLYAIGKPLPFPEAQPWKMSKRYKLFQAIGRITSRFGNRD